MRLDCPVQPLQSIHDPSECRGLALLDLAHFLRGLDAVQLLPDGGAYKSRFGTQPVGLFQSLGYLLLPIFGNNLLDSHQPT
jgi:hypothetical protein